MKIEIHLPEKIAKEYQNEAEKTGVEVEILIEYILLTILVMSKISSAKERMEFGDKLDNGESEGLKIYKEILESINDRTK